MQKRILHQIKLTMAVLGVLLSIAVVFMMPVQTQASDQNVTMTSCKLNSSGSKLTVKAKVKKKTSAMGKKLYLLKLDAQSAESGKKSTTPLASVKTKKGTVTFKIKYDSSLLYQKFVVAYKSGKKYQIVSDARYITNPEVLATYKGKGPSVTSKKGLQAEELSDSLEIGTKHAVINWTLNSLLNDNAINKVAYKYRGKTYYLDADQLQRNDELVQAYNAAGVRVTVILLLPKDVASTGTKAMQYGGYSYTKFSSFKTTTKTSCRTFEAVMTYLASRYGTKENLVCGWILGNEVNSACVWNYGGNKSLSTYMKNYARAFRICYNAVRSVSKNAKVYISLDNQWNKDTDGSGNRYFTSKATVDKFYEKLKEQGAIDFQIAFHAYPQGMSDPVFWDDSWATNSTNAKIINFKNLSVLTKYAKKNFGKKCTVMFSEQSFNSTRGEAVQAAAYAYAYYLCETNSMVEAFIYGREFDNAEETRYGYRWGLCDEWHAKRLIWSVFQYIDTKDSFKFTDPLVKYTNLKKWTKISGLKRSKFTGMASIRTKGAITEIESVSKTSVKLTWQKQNTADGYEIYRDGSLLDTIAGNSNVTYTDENLVTGSSYQYQVRMYKEAPDASNAAKRTRLYGSLSEAVPVTVTCGQVTLNTDKCSVEGNQITVAWKKISDVSGYEIYRSTTEDGEYSLIGTAGSSKTSYKDSQTLSGTTYYYKVRAFVTTNGVNGYGKFSEPVDKTALIELTGSVVGKKIVLNWTQWKNITEYRVEAVSETDSKFGYQKYVSGCTHTLSNYRDNAAVRSDFGIGASYRFRVCAVLENGKWSAYSNVISITFQPTDTVSATGISDMETDTENSDVTESTEPVSTETMTEVPETESQQAEPVTEAAGTESQPTEAGTKTAETESQQAETGTELSSTEDQQVKPDTEVPDTKTELTETAERRPD